MTTTTQALLAVWADDDRPNSVVYFAANRAAGTVKIGRTRNLAARMATLRTSIPDLDLLGCFPGGPRAEADLHATFAADRVGGEWFRLTLPLALTIRALCAESGAA